MLLKPQMKNFEKRTAFNLRQLGTHVIHTGNTKVRK